MFDKPSPYNLDKHDNSNAQIKQLKHDTALNMLREVANMFDYATESKVRAYAERLVEKNIKLQALELACEKIINNFDRFPSYKAFLELINRFNPAIEKHRCDKCDSLGLVSLYRKSDGVCYAFACGCSNGAMYPAFKRITSINLNEFTRFAPTDPECENPYKSFNARWQKYLQSMGKIS